jgi:hypothetical protein
MRFPVKIKQFIFFNRKKLNSSFKVKISKFFSNNYEYDFKIINNINKLRQDKNFILSAMNLAFLGSYGSGDISKNKYMINWPDGIFSKILKKNIKKIPGRDIILSIKLIKTIKEIVVFGNLKPDGKKFLERKFKLPVTNINLPYDTTEKIVDNLNYRIKKKQLILITLPTPKQEVVANYLSSINRYFKIICIGGSIAIASGSEKKVPDQLINFEFIWRLRYDTIRRSKRLFLTFMYFFYSYFLNKKLKNLKIQII